MVNFDIHKKKKNHISLTPLIDVVFILLIFFMLATSFTKWNSITFKSANSGASNESEFRGTLIHISKSGKYTLNNKTLMLEDLEAILRRKVKLNANHYVVIMPDDQTPLQETINLMSAMKPIVGDKISLTRSL